MNEGIIVGVNNLAKRLGVGRTTVTRWVKEKALPVPFQEFESGGNTYRCWLTADIEKFRIKLVKESAHQRRYSGRPFSNLQQTPLL